MASPPPFQVEEDQTDEDFFDKLVDDEFAVEGSHSESAEKGTAFSNLSIGGDEAASLEDFGDAGFATEVEVRGESSNMQQLSEAPGMAVRPRTESGSPSSTMERAHGSKGTSVKVVQWNVFNADSQPFGTSGLEPFSDFLTENADGSADDKLKGNSDPGFSVAENSVENLSTYVGSGGQQAAQLYGSASDQGTDLNNAQYWENLYPGWKYDPSTGQWYQVDGYAMNAQEGFEDKVEATVDGSISEISDLSYLQQAAPSVLETIAEDSETSTVANWNQVSYGSMEYPQNMVFDPQYPGWYYDTNTQQWYTLESYTQAIQGTSSAVQDQLSQDTDASAGWISEQNHSLYSEVGKTEQHTIQYQGSQEFGGGWNESTTTSSHAQQNMWQPGPVDNGGQHRSTNRFYNSKEHEGSNTDQQIGFKTFEPVSSHNYGSGNGVSGFQGVVPAESIYPFNQPKFDQNRPAHLSNSNHGNQNSVSNSQQQFEDANASYSQFPYAPNVERSSAGRPPHALVSFGFGGKLVVMKDGNSFGTKSNYGSQDTVGSAVSILSLMEVVMDKADASSIVSASSCDYFHALCQQSFPGPLVGGSAATKDVSKWIDERIVGCESPCMDFQKGKLLRLLFSLLKISCQHYGKLRSPFGADSSLEETDGPESAITKLFASARKNSVHLREYGSSTHCIQNLPSEGQIRATTAEVQNLLVSGRRKEALQFAQEGQLWGPALVLAAQFGEKFYVDTVRQMAHHQFVAGSPLRTLCLLIAGQPADVFSVDCFANSLSGAANAPQQSTEIQATGMLEDWEENLAIITANRTKDDELVIVHLGDCLWKERGEITAAHTCYLVAEANFESYSDCARLCLIGADHWKYPRTYASPEAIQRTEVYEYSKVLGNSQFILLPFQPYKLIYAYMLAEVGKVSDSLRYCQASLKLLKNSGRSPEVESWKSLLSSLEDQLRTHQQGGYSTNLDPAKLVGKIFTSIDRSIHRMIGAPPPPLPPVPQSSVKGRENYGVAPKVANSQSTMAMSSLVPSASVEAMSEWTGDSSRKTRHNRSVSEPDFGRSSKQDAGSADRQSKGSGGSSRFGRIGSQLFQKTMGWVSRSRPDGQAKLGERNKFYYDEKLKRWVEEGAEPPAEEAALPPPPTAAAFHNDMSGYNIDSVFKAQSPPANGGPETKSLVPSEYNSGIPPVPPSQNQFSARGRTGVRSRYVDTFNKGGGPSASSFQSPSTPSVKPAVGAKFFVPTTPAASNEQPTDATEESRHEVATDGEARTSAVVKDVSLSSPSTSSSSMPRFPSMDNMRSRAALQSGNGPLSRTRAASWSGAYTETFPPKMADANPSPIHSSSSSSLQLNGGGLVDDLHEVEL